MQESEREVIKRRIRALSEKTEERGCSEAEAMIAMKKIGELLTQYNLSMDEVTMRQEPCVTKVFQTNARKRNAVWHTRGGIQKLCGVKVWMSRNTYTGTGITFSFFGLEPDVDLGIYLAGLIQESEKRSIQDFRKSEIWRASNARQTATANFKIGFGGRINARLYDLTTVREAAEKQSADFHAETMRTKGFMVEATDEAKVEAAKQTTGTALICVAKAKFIEEEFKKRGPKLSYRKAPSSSGRYDPVSRAAGAAAGNKVNLSRPVGGNKGPSGLLT